MPHNPILGFRTRLKAGPAAFAAWVGMKDPASIDGLVREGFDCAILDWQHGFQDSNSVTTGILAAASAGVPALVRIGIGEFSSAARFLDWGAAGIVAPMVNSAEDARLFADFVKFPPVGARSWGPLRAIGMTGLAPVDYLHKANDATLAIAMIETREALDALDDIFAVPGIDGVLVGPSDLSITLTDGATIDAAHPLVDAALTEVAKAARRHGKLASAFCMDGARAGELATRGFHLLSIGSDQLLLRMAGRQELAKAKGIAAKAGAGTY